MQTLIMYDESDFIISQIQGNNLREPVGMPFMKIEIPQGKLLVSIDVSKNPHEPVFEDIVIPYDPVKWE